MVGRDGDGADADLLGVARDRGDAREVAQRQAFCAPGGDPRGELGVEAGELPDEALRVGLFEPGRGDEGLDFDIGELDLRAELTREDDGLAGDVEARQVVSRVRLGQAPRPRCRDGL